MMSFPIVSTGSQPRYIHGRLIDHCLLPGADLLCVPWTATFSMQACLQAADKQCASHAQSFCDEVMRGLVCVNTNETGNVNK